MGVLAAPFLVKGPLQNTKCPAGRGLTEMVYRESSLQYESAWTSCLNPCALSSTQVISMVLCKERKLCVPYHLHHSDMRSVESLLFLMLMLTSSHFNVLGSLDTFLWNLINYTIHGQFSKLCRKLSKTEYWLFELLGNSTIVYVCIYNVSLHKPCSSEHFLRTFLNLISQIMYSYKRCPTYQWAFH